MKIKQEQEKGVTLMALVITVIILLIILSIGVSTGKNIIKSSKFTAFTTEMKIMQTKVNEWNQAYQNNDKISIDGENFIGAGNTETGEKGIQEIGEDLTAESQQILNTIEVNEILSEKAEGDQTRLTEIKDGFRLLTQSYLTEKLKVESITSDYLVNVKERIVVCNDGFKYENVMYYMLEQIDNGLYNVEYKEQNSKEGDFTVKATKVGDEWQIEVSNIQHEKYVSKWQVKYQKEGSDIWHTSDSLIFNVPEGVYQVKVVHGNEISLNAKRVKATYYADQPELGGTTFSRAVGTTDIVFLKDTSYTEGEANAPEIDENTMIPIKYNGTNWVVTTKSDPDWYNYSTESVTQSDGTVTEARKWANVMLSDGTYNAGSVTAGTEITDEADLGSMFVWIPRYAYKIIYFNTEDDKTKYIANNDDSSVQIVGYSDARGIVNAEGKVPTDVTGGTTSIAVGDNYRPHPVFEKDISKGGWGKNTTGIWVGKFETTTKTSLKGTNMIVPNQTSQRNLKVADMYTKAKAIGETLGMALDSHMIKNSEWGATAYLTESKYGRNGIEVSVNQCSDFYTGVGRGLNGDTDVGNQTGTNQIYNSEYSWSSINSIQKYNGVVGKLSSSTGNEYGIYDLSGGSWEYVMGFYEDENGVNTGYDESYMSGFNGYLGYSKTEYTNGVNLPEEKYYQKYPSYNASSIGDAIFETSISNSNNNSWNQDWSCLVNSNNPVSLRGGSYNNANNAGVLCLFYYSGSNYDNCSFRPVLVEF